MAFLTIDHINGDGGKHRRSFGRSIGVYIDLKDRGWPKEGYQLLCFNCHMATRFGEPCPHPNST